MPNKLQPSSDSVENMRIFLTQIHPSAFENFIAGMYNQFGSLERVENMIREYGVKTPREAASALNVLLTWTYTDQGFDYWENIYLTLRSMGEKRPAQKKKEILL